VAHLRSVCGIPLEQLTKSVIDQQHLLLSGFQRMIEFRKPAAALLNRRQNSSPCGTLEKLHHSLSFFAPSR
jgi:hypothetical protein